MDKIELTDIGLMILSTMVKPIHGYEIMNIVDKYFINHFSLGPATLYTTLKKLSDNKLCIFENVATKKVYRLTQLGEKVLINEYEKLKKIENFVALNIKGVKNK